MKKKSSGIGDIEKFSDSLERQYYQGFDPYFFYSAASVARSGSMAAFSVELPDGSEVIDHEIIQGLKYSQSQLENTKATIIRMYRYFAAETMLLTILCAKPHHPAYRLTSILRGDKLNAAFRAINERRVPEKYGVKDSGETLSFRQWLGIKLFSNKDAFNEGNAESIFKFITSEAGLVCERGAINSFKHGRPVGYGASPIVKLISQDANVSMESVPFHGISWVSWSESNKSLSIDWQTEESDIKDDIIAILYSCQIAEIRKKIRLAEIDGTSKLTISIPIFRRVFDKPKRQKFNINFNAI